MSIAQSDITAPSNPFATRYVRPGAIPYLFLTGEDCDLRISPNPSPHAAPARSSNLPQPRTIAPEEDRGENLDLTCAGLLSRWQSAGRRGSVIGPHGVGKSTLLRYLADTLDRTGETVHWAGLNSTMRSLPRNWPRISNWTTSVVCVDGYEQLSWWGRWQLRGLAWRGCGILVSTHTPCEFPELVQLRPSRQTFTVVVRRLVAGRWEISDKVIDLAWAAGNQNPREALFWLYDWWENNSRVPDHITVQP